MGLDQKIYSEDVAGGGKYKDNEALYINTQTGEKVVIFAGGGQADSYKRILGNSYRIMDCNRDK